MFFGVHLAVCGLILSLTPAVRGSTLVGRVYSEDGQPVGGALVSVQTTMAPASGLISHQTVTDVQGKFVLDLPEDNYSVCVTAPKDLLNSCEWPSDDYLVRIKGPSVQVKMILKAGLTFRVRVNDSSKLLASTDKANAGSSLEFTVWDALGHSHPIREVSGDDQGKNLELLVPPGAQLRLAVKSSDVDLLDKNGLAVPQSSIAISTQPVDLAEAQVYQVTPVATKVDSK